MKAHGILILASIAAMAPPVSTASAVGMAPIARPAPFHVGVPVGRGHDRGPGIDRRRGLILPLIAPAVVEPPAESSAPASIEPQPAPLVIAAPACAPPKVVEPSGPRIIYVNEVPAAPSKESQGVTIIYGRPVW